MPPRSRKQRATPVPSGKVLQRGEACAGCHPGPEQGYTAGIHRKDLDKARTVSGLALPPATCWCMVNNSRTAMGSPLSAPWTPAPGERGPLRAMDMASPEGPGDPAVVSLIPQLLCLKCSTLVKLGERHQKPGKVALGLCVASTNCSSFSGLFVFQPILPFSSFETRSCHARRPAHSSSEPLLSWRMPSLHTWGHSPQSHQLITILRPLGFSWDCPNQTGP